MAVDPDLCKMPTLKGIDTFELMSTLLRLAKCSPEEIFTGGNVPRNVHIDNLLKTAGSVCASIGLASTKHSCPPCFLAALHGLCMTMPWHQS